MARYNIESINYISVGKTEKIFNVDISFDEDENATSSDVEQTDAAINTDEDSVLLEEQLGGQSEEHEKMVFNKIFVADIDDDSVIGTGDSNKFSIESSDESNQVRIHPVYDIDDICIKSSIKKIKNSSSEYKNKSEDYVDIYVPELSDGVLDFCQMDNYAYYLSKRTEKGPTMLQTDLYEQSKETAAGDIDDQSYHWKLKTNELKTFVYNTYSDMDEDDQATLSNYYKPKYNFKGVKYNYVIEVPQNLPTGTYNDYEAGDIQGDIFQAKNTYDTHYSMNMPNLSSLVNTRDYIGLANCGDRIFIKYFDNIDYQIGITRRLSGDVNVVEDTYAYETKHSRYPFQKIETLDSINRFRSNIRHKSPLYSLKISNSGINCLEEGSRERIKKDIKNSIRQMTRKLCPATTQLFDVFFDS